MNTAAEIPVVKLSILEHNEEKRLFADFSYNKALTDLINPDEALERTNKKFIYRFQYLEEAAKKNGKSLSDMTLEEMDVYWNEAKKK